MNEAPNPNCKGAVDRLIGLGSAFFKKAE